MFVVWSSQGDEFLGCIISRWANKMNRKREKECIQSDQPAWNPGGASATPKIRKFLFLTVLSLFAQCKMHYWWLVTWLDLTLWWVRSCYSNFKHDFRWIAQHLGPCQGFESMRRHDTGSPVAYPKHTIFISPTTVMLRKSILLSVFISYFLFKVTFFISIIPSKICRFKLAVSWLCDDHIAAENLGRKVLDIALWQPPIRAVEGLRFSKTNAIFIASRELVDDSRMGTAIGPWSR
jgi:hypothetical protein